MHRNGFFPGCPAGCDGPSDRLAGREWLDRGGSIGGTTCLSRRHKLPDFSGLALVRIVFALIVFLPSLAVADFRVNATTSSTQETSSLNRGSQQAVSFDSSGNLVFVWTSTGQDFSSSKGVYARRIAFDGTALTGELAVNVTTTGNQSQASVASDDAGNFVVTWTSDGQDGSGTGVFVRRFAADGTALTGEIAVNTTTNGAQGNSVIALNRRSGGFLVAWEGQGEGDADGIFYRRFAADASPQDGVEQRANRIDSGTEQNPSVAMGEAGDFVIAFEVNSDIHLQRFDSSGTYQGSATQVDELLVAASVPAVAMAANGDIACFYRVDNILGLLAGVWGSGYASDGTRRYATFQVAAGDATSPSIAMTASGEFVVTYEMTSSGTIDTFAKRYDSDFTAGGAAVTVNQYTTGSQRMASAAVRHIENYAVVWSGKASGDSSSVSARIFGAQPVATNQNVTTLEDSARVITLTGGDADGDAIEFIILERPAYGDISGFNPTTGTLTYTPTNGFIGTDSFFFVADDGVSNSAIAMVTIVVGAIPPVVTLAPVTQSIADGGAVTLSVSATGTAPLTYQWMRNGAAVAGATNSLLSLTNASLENSGNYVAVVSNSAGSVTSQVAVVTVLAVAPVITSQPESQTVADGTDVSFSVTATGTEPLSYRWKRGSATVAGATNATLQVSNVVPGLAGDYLVVVSNTAGAVTSVVAVLTVETVAPTITQQPESQTVTDGSNVTFSVTVSGSRPMQYQWAVGGVNISNATNATLSLSNVTFSAAGNYTVTASNVSGVVTSLVAVLTVVPLAPSIVSQPVSQTVYDGTNVSFAVTAIGTAPLRYQWMRDGVDLTSETNSTLTFTNVTLSEGGNYAVVVSNSVGSVTSVVATLTVLAVPPSITTQPFGRTINDGDEVSFSVVAIGTGPLTYSWVSNSVAVAGATNTTWNLGTVGVSASGSYFAVVTGPGGSVTSSVVTLTVLSVPPSIISQPLSITTNAGSEVTFAVTAIGTPPLTYQWQRNGVPLTGETGSALTFTNVQVADSGVYRVVVQNAQGSAASADATLQVVVAALGMTDNFTAEITSTNSSGVGQSSNTLATAESGEPLHAEKIGGKSMWFSWQAPATGIATFSTAGSDFDTLLAVYQGDSVGALTAVVSDDDSAGFYNSRVQFNVVSNGVYRIVVDGAGGASGNILLEWSLEETTDVLPVITNQPTDRIVSLTSNAVFTVGVSGAGVAYQWFFNNVAVPDGTNSTWTQRALASVMSACSKCRRRSVRAPLPASRQAWASRCRPDWNRTLRPRTNSATRFRAVAGCDSIRRRRRASRVCLPMWRRRAVGIPDQVFGTVKSLEPGEPDHCGVPGGASRWFAFEAETDGVLDLNTDGSTFDTILAVYTGTNANFSELTAVACDNDSDTNGVTSSLHFTTVTGTIYYIAVDGVNGASGTVVLNYSTLGEQQRPSITVTSAPPANVGLTNDTVTISGIATDNTDLVAVQWRMTNSLGSTTWTNTTGTNAWTFVASNLAFGRNTIQIRSFDSWGNYSATNSINYVRFAPVIVTVEGCGSVTAGFLGTTYREPGKSVVITATACANSLFTGWSGDRTTNANTINVLIQTGLVVQASFMTNPFALRPGTYAGLAYDTNVVSHERAGFVTIRTTPKGTYSGKLRLGGRNLSFSGAFGLDGLATNSIRRGSLEAPLGVELNFNSGALVQGIEGRLHDTNWSSELVAYRAVFHSKTNLAPQTGRYTLILPASGEPDTPEGDGFASITVASSGVAKLKGLLADNTAISHAAPMSREGLWPFHVSLRGGRGAIWSWLAFETNAVTIGTNLVQGDLSGEMRWVAKPVLSAKYYPAGFTNAIDAVGARYQPPTNSLYGALTFSNGVVVFSGGNLTTPFTNRIQHAATDKVVNEETNALSMTISRATGLFSGSVVVPESGAKVPFKGALFQSGDVGFGFSLQTNVTGPVLLAPRE
ncbi:MAG: immunoglobulin domain-containing protein [Verrucomicrobia bacterium]|nr:immunoglobulin domain-containing protein [Verrucomicrobiota bacterium]